MEKSILITGASRGIGLAIAKKLYLVARRELLVASNRRSFVEVAGSFGEKAVFLDADLTRIEEIERLCTDVGNITDAVDVLINNAGIYLPRKLENLERSEIQEHIDLNLRALIMLTQCLLPLLKRANRAQIINISSMAARANLFGEAVYSATKAAVTSFSDTIRKELNSEGIRVTVIHPWGVNTWDDPKPENLLSVEDVAEVVSFIVQTEAELQIESVDVSSINQWRGDPPPWIPR